MIPKKLFAIVFSIIIIANALCGCVAKENINEESRTTIASSDILKNIPPFTDKPYVTINDNIPAFSKEDITADCFESYSPLDSLGRCGIAMACIGLETMPVAERQYIGNVKPTGWHTIKYDIVNGKYLYNRCHLIGYQLTAENANKLNLITGTRYMNTDGMLPFENLTCDYIKETLNHVLYRVTPIFEGDNLVARGVQMEALSVEDNGEGVCFNVFVYNCQPGIDINYTDGSSAYLDNAEMQTGEHYYGYIINTNTKKIHDINCPHVNSIKNYNQEKSTLTIEELLNNGYTKCKYCNPD